MDIDWTLVGRLAVGSVPVIAAVIGFFRGPGVLRTRLNHDVALLEKLPADSSPYVRLLGKIDEQLGVIDELDRNGKRDWQGAIIAFLLIVGLVALALWLWSFHAWWGYTIAVGLVIFALAGISSMIESLEFLPRDAKGNTLQSESDDR